MADESQKPSVGVSGATELVGVIVSKVDARTPSSNPIFSGRTLDVWMFRVKDDHSERVVPVRFEGPINAMLDQGDHIRVRGYLMKGVLEAREIRGDQSEVLAQSKCFVATAVFQDLWAPEVETLRRFRSQVLKRHAWGRRFIAWYWHRGPRFARIVSSRPWLVKALRRLLKAFSRLLSAWPALAPAQTACQPGLRNESRLVRRVAQSET